jgi:hypothetical protein
MRIVGQLGAEFLPTQSRVFVSFSNCPNELGRRCCQHGMIALVEPDLLHIALLQQRRGLDLQSVIQGFKADSYVATLRPARCS